MIVLVFKDAYNKINHGEQNLAMTSKVKGQGHGASTIKCWL